MNVYLKHKKKDGGAGGMLSVPPCRKGLNGMGKMNTRIQEHITEI